MNSLVDSVVIRDKSSNIYELNKNYLYYEHYEALKIFFCSRKRKQNYGGLTYK